MNRTRRFGRAIGWVFIIVVGSIFWTAVIYGLTHL